MRADTVTAICAVVIAFATLIVATWQGYLDRDHYRRSLRPALELRYYTDTKEPSGILFVNSGLGPAVVLGSRVSWKGEEEGSWNRRTAETIQRKAGIPFLTNIFIDGSVIEVGCKEYLVSVALPLAEPLARGLRIAIQYESLYGGEHFEAVF
ncbi:hypothetical protein ACOKM5_07705 [Streptomyces sp. BH097]|uniref:hypothetical protein n=1 Tax=unclassified Streptomyces TaxID=2593676 RepID=UPI003BB6B2BE